MSKPINLLNKVFLIVVSGEITVSLSTADRAQHISTQTHSSAGTLITRGMSSLLHVADDTDGNDLYIVRSFCEGLYYFLTYSQYDY